MCTFETLDCFPPCSRVQLGTPHLLLDHVHQPKKAEPQTHFDLLRERERERENCKFTWVLFEHIFTRYISVSRGCRNFRAVCPAASVFSHHFKTAAALDPLEAQPPRKNH